MAISNFFKKIIYPDGDNDYENENYDEYEDEFGEQPLTPPPARQPKAAERTEAPAYTAPAPSGNINMTSGSAIEMKVVKPDTLETVTQIADCLLDRKTILLNLEDTSKETARRLIDFLNGVSYAINGDLKKVASNTYVVTPNNVEVSGENIKENVDKNDIV
ncbi:MAG: cell division protein SepF [Clostridia bacterium]|nr:cell division protein SepF [Clostridia bacterium]